MPLVHALTRQKDAWSPRQRRHLSAIAEFNCTLTHLPGKKNPVADALSRIEINAVQLGLDYNQLAKEQQQDPETTAVRTAITAIQWKDVPLGDSNISILCDVSTGRPRPWIPSSLRRHVFNLIHGLSHPSRRATTQLLTQKFIWHKISRDAGNWVRSCVPCQKSKVHRHTETGPGAFHQPQRRFAHIHVDVVGPLPMDIVTCSPLSIAPPDGQKPSPWPTQHLLHAPPPCCQVGSPDSAFLNTSPPTVAQPSHRIYGPPWDS
ncbi:hypothetical protein Pcinc_014973 [Petrolisthes cinctipes]|uniref:RNA-directed DNA polymerase n=1 Tax=Petrolisthes cinctipes TaxID=88211 RepID=A0AAE1FUC4_PETCI|nr:hypothetical protein Pcinc_014973 [Petrolisthes cinctipes]